MNGFTRGASAIVAATTHGLGEAPGFSAMDLAAAASVKALAAIDLKPRDVDAIFVALPDDPLSGLGLAEHLGGAASSRTTTGTGGSSFRRTIHAALALEARECDVALIAYGSISSAAGKLITSLRPIHERAIACRARSASYALAAARYMHCYGVTRDALAEVDRGAPLGAAQPGRLHAGRVTREGYFKARMVTDPLGAATAAR
jgi:acetyl-CoA acetyltransferase